MNTTFSISRLGKLIANEYCVNFKKIMLSIGILFGIAFIYFGFAAILKQHVNIEFTYSFFVLIILAYQGYITSICFSEFSSKPRTLSWLLIPASKQEKFASKFIYCMIIFPLIFLLYHFLVIKMSFVYNSWATEIFNLPWHISRDEDFILRMTRIETIITILVVWFCAASSFLCGAQFFKKHSQNKTFLVALLSIIVITVLLRFLYFLVAGHMPSGYVPFLFIMEVVGKNVYSYSFIDVHHYAIHWLGVFVGLYLIVVSWVRFNEKTI